MKIRLAILSLAALLSVTASCSTAAVDYMVTESDQTSQIVIEKSLGLNRPWYSSLFSSRPPTVVELPPPTPSDTLVPGGPDTQTAEDASSSRLSDTFAIDTSRMIVRTGDLRLVVDDISTTLARIAALAEDSGGYVVSSNQWKEQGRFVGTVSIRVPAGEFDETMREIREMSVEVVSDQTSSEDVSQEYVDLQAKLRNLEAAEDQLLVIMQKATQVKDILDVQQELTKTREEIERTKGRMQYLEQTSQTSLIAVALAQSSLEVKLVAINGRYAVGGEPVYFTAEISGGFAPYAYQWDFGDGTASNETVPQHAFGSSGQHTVSLTVTDDRGNAATDTRADYIIVRSGWSIANVARTAWNGLRTLGQVLVNILVWVGIFSPVLIVIGGIVYLVRRRLRRRTEAE